MVSNPTRQALGYEELEALVEPILPTDLPLIILGESFSGRIAVSIAASKPAGLVALVLCCSFVRNPRPATSLLLSLVSVPLVSLAPPALLAPFLLGRQATASLKAMFAASLSQVSAHA